MPAAYDESSASSTDPSSNESSDSESFHTPGNSPTSAKSPLAFEDLSQVVLRIPNADIPKHLCRDFYRSGRCYWGSRCSYKHERPPADEIAGLVAKVSLPPATLAHPLPERPAPRPSALPPHHPALSLPTTSTASVSVSPVSLRTLTKPTLPPRDSHMDRAARPPSMPNRHQDSLLLTLCHGSGETARLPPAQPLSNVCPSFAAHGFCKTSGCEFVHSLPDPNPPRPPGPPRPGIDSHHQEVSQ